MGLQLRARNAAARVPLRWRVAFVAFVLLAVLMGALGMLISFTEQRALLSNQAIALENEASLALAGPGWSSHLSDVAARLAGASTRVTIYAPDGSILATSNNLPQVPPAVDVSAAMINQAIVDPPASGGYVVLRDVTGQRELVVLFPLASNGQPVGVLALSQPIRAIDRAVATTRTILAFGIIAALAIAAALLLPLMRAALSPLREMERTTRRIAEGELSLRLEVPPVHDEVGQLARSFNAMVARLEAAFTRQKRFVADVSHELRTPLTALGGGLEMLLLGADSGDPEAGRRLLRGMYAEVERMRRLVQDLLTLARLDEGHLPAHVQPVEVEPLLSALCDEAQRLARGQEVRCDTAADLPPVLADPDGVRQVLLILLDNAIKFTPADGRVDLIAARHGPRLVRITVRDTGAGIAPQDLPHVFDRFYRVDAARTRASGHGGGSGLGLAIARALTQASGGTLTLASAPGEGTSATLELPAAIPVAAPAARPRTGAEGSAEQPVSPAPAAGSSDVSVPAPRAATPG